MANLAQIQSIAQGQFFVKDSLGNLTELKVGDTVSLNDTIVAASSNTDLSKIEILFDTNELITLSQGEQLLDTTLLASTFGNEELAFDKQEVDETLNAWNNTEAGDETDMETAAGDVTEQATNAGDERAADGGALRSKFNSRDGDATDIVSDLREASWTDGIEGTIQDTENMLLEDPLPVVYTIIEGIDVVNEGDSANYVVKLQDAAGNPVIATQDTIIYVRYTNKTTQDGDTQYNNENIIEVVIKAGTSQTEFTIKTNDDYLADNGEIYNVAITGNNSTEFDMRTGDVAGNKTNVDTTILDNSNPLNPRGEDGGYGSEDTVYVKISQPSETLEGGKLSHTVTLVDKDGNPVTIPAGEKIIVTLTYTSTDGVTDGDFSTIVKEVELVSNGTTFENTTIVDNTYEGSENYTVTITDVKQTNGTYENVAIHQTENSTTGKITDNPVEIVLVATDSTRTIPLKADGTVDLEANKNSTPEGGKLYYVAVAVDTNGKPLDKQTGKVDVSYNNTSDITDKDAILSGTGKDIKNNPTVVEIGKTFTVDAEDDYYAEGDEKFNVTISNPKDTGYDTGVSVKSGADTVTSTIKDNPASDTENPKTPIEDGGYGSEDTVYVKIEGSPTVVEGGELSHTVTLVDKDGNPVTIPAGEKIIVTLTYTSTDGVTDGDFSTIVKEVELVSNGTTFENTTIVDNTYEGSENYTVTITDVKQTNGTYENVAIHQTENSTTGKITDNPVEIVLVATDSTRTIPLKADGTVDLEANKNSTPEGGKLYYVAVAVDTNGKPLDKQTGKVDVSYNNTSDITDKDAILSGTGKDIKNNPTVVEIGKTFTVDAEDDYYAEGDEKFNVTISNPKDTGYDTGVSVKSGADTVTSTIKDNVPVKNHQVDGTGGIDGTIYGKEDTVYAVITPNTTSVVEGGEVTYTVKLVDSTGKEVKVTSDTKVTVTFGTNNSVSDGEVELKGTPNNNPLENGENITITIPKNGNSASFTIKTKDDFAADNDETFNLKITDIDSKEFENIVYDDKNGINTTIKDGVTLGTPKNAYVDEDNFYKNDFNNTDSSSEYTTKNISNFDNKTGHIKGDLGIIAPIEDNGYTLSFDNTINVYKGNENATETNIYGDGTALKSGGQVIEYVVNGDTITGYAGTGRINSDKVFDIKLNKNEKGGSDDNYKYTQYKNIDHPVAGDATDPINDDNITFEFGFKISDQGSTSSVQTFKVTVNDSTPISGEKTLTIYEDNNGKYKGAYTFVLSDEAFKDQKIKIDNNDGNGFKEYSTNDTVKIYEGSKEVGTIKILKGGKLEFKPAEDYSKYTNDNLPNFKYQVSDTDGDYAEGKVNIKVKPVADAPTVTVKNIETTEDYNNTQEGTNKVALELKVPSLSKDQTDKNNATGDSPERNGEITLSFTNGGSLVSKAENKNIPNTGAKLFYTKDNGDITEIENFLINSNKNLKVVIVETSGLKDIDTKYHYDGLNPTAGKNEKVVYLTQKEYESLKIQHAEDNDTDIKITINVKSYEVDDSGKPLNASDSTYADKTNSNLSKTTTANMTVIIKPVTDDISLKWNDTKSSEIDKVGKLEGEVLIFNPITENNSNPKIVDGVSEQKIENELNFGSLLTPTSGAGTDTKLDLDGSEKRSYSISLVEKNGADLPDYIYITIGDDQKDIKVELKDGVYKLDFSDKNNKLVNPEFKIKFPDYWSGDVTGTITLRTKDYGVDNDPDTTKYISGEADGVKKAEVKFEAKVTSIANIATIQVKQAIGYEDAGRGGDEKNQPKTGDILENGKDGIPLDIKVTSTDKDNSETFTIKISNIPNGGAIHYNGQLLTPENGKDYIEIPQFNNDLELKFILPHNSHGDFDLIVNVKTIDGNDTRDYTDNPETTIKVVVKDVADSVVGNEYAIEDLSTDTNYKKPDERQHSTFNKVVDEADAETNGISLNSIFTDDATKLASYDSASEDLTIIIKDLPAGVTLEGANLNYVNGQYIFKATDIDGITIKTPVNYSGELNFKIDYITTEAGKEANNPSKTFDSKKTTDSVSIFVKPTVDAGFNSNTTKAEDVGAESTADGKSYYKLDLGISYQNGDADETLVSVKLDKPTDGDFKLFIKNSDGSFSEIIDFTKTYTESELKDIYVQAPENKHGNFDITGTYTVKDSQYGSKDVNYETVKTDKFKHTLTITPVTDKPTITVEDGVQTKIEVISGEAKTIEIPIKVTSVDKDESENITKILISGVPQGVTISFGDAESDAKVTVSEHNGIYTIVPKDGNYKLNDADFKNITFNVTSVANFEHRDITITAYTKDAQGSNEESTSTVITLDKSHTGTGGGNGSGIGIELKDGNPYKATEDTEFNFLDVFKVVIADGGSDGRVTLNFTLDSTNATIKGLTANANGSYTITGNRADIESVLANLKVVPNKDYNDNHTTDKGTLDITVTIDGKTPVIAKVPVTPVTDAMSIKVEATPTDLAGIVENKPVDLKITLINSVDGKHTEEIKSITIKVTETWKDNAIGEVTEKGLLTDTRGNYKINENLDGTYTITKKDGTSFDFTEIKDLQYTPTTNRNGDVSFDVIVNHKEIDGKATMDTLENGSRNAIGSKVITVKPVVSSEIMIKDADKQNGIEDTRMASAKLTVEKYDPSEKFESVLIKVASGVAVYYDNGTKLAMNLGGGSWLIPVSGDGKTLPQVFFKGKEHFGGEIKFDAIINVKDGDSKVSSELIKGSVTITEVADGVTIDPTKTGIDKNAFEWTTLNLNANMKDIDGSEKMHFTLEGLDSSAQFRVNNGDGTYTDLSSKASQDATGKWTIDGIEAKDINSIEISHDKSVSGVKVEASTVDGDNVSTSPSVSGTFDLSYKADAKFSNGSFTLAKDMDIDFNNIGKLGFTNVEKIDLGAGNGKNELLNLTLDDVLSIGKKDGSGNINLDILGGTDDKVSFAKDNGWKKSELLIQDQDSGKTFVEWTNTGDSTVSVKVEQPISDGITN